MSDNQRRDAENPSPTPGTSTSTTTSPDGRDGQAVSSQDVNRKISDGGPTPVRHPRQVATIAPVGIQQPRNSRGPFGFSLTRNTLQDSAMDDIRRVTSSLRRTSVRQSPQTSDAVPVFFLQPSTSTAPPVFLPSRNMGQGYVTDDLQRMASTPQRASMGQPPLFPPFFFTDHQRSNPSRALCVFSPSTTINQRSMMDDLQRMTSTPRRDSVRQPPQTTPSVMADLQQPSTSRAPFGSSSTTNTAQNPLADVLQIMTTILQDVNSAVSGNFNGGVPRCEGQPVNHPSNLLLIILLLIFFLRDFLLYLSFQRDGHSMTSGRQLTSQPQPTSHSQPLRTLALQAMSRVQMHSIMSSSLQFAYVDSLYTQLNTLLELPAELRRSFPYREVMSDTLSMIQLFQTNPRAQPPSFTGRVRPNLPSSHRARTRRPSLGRQRFQRHSTRRYGRTSTSNAEQPQTLSNNPSSATPRISLTPHGLTLHFSSASPPYSHPSNDRTRRLSEANLPSTSRGPTQDDREDETNDGGSSRTNENRQSEGK